MVRVEPVHYNTVEEIRRFGEVLRRIMGSEDQINALAAGMWDETGMRTG
jgi:hypothetical protein